MKRLVLASNNEGKIREIQAILAPRGRRKGGCGKAAIRLVSGFESEGQVGLKK